MKINCSYTELVETHKIVPHPKNSNKHPDDQIERLAKIIDYQGQRSPVVISKNSGFIVTGHGRFEAMQKLGYEKIAVDYQDFENEAQEYAHLNCDNAIANWSTLDLAQINQEMLDMGPELDIEMLGIKDFVLEPIEKFEPQCDENAVPELKADPITKTGDVWLLGNHRLMCGDSTMIDDVEKLMNDEKAPLLFTSPPYSDMRDYNGGKDLAIGNLTEFITSFSHFSEYQVINLGLQRKDSEIYDYWTPYIEKARDNGYLFLSWNIWDKGEAGSIGNQTAMFPICHEWIFVFGRKKLEINCNKKNKSFGDKVHGTNRNKDGTTTAVSASGKIREFGKRGTVTKMTPHKHSAKNPSVHPAMFPVSLAEEYIEDMTNHGDFIIEPFCGSGTTLIASEKTNRKCYGMELDEKYCDVIIKRWQKYTGKQATLESTQETYDSLSGDL